MVAAMLATAPAGPPGSIGRDAEVGKRERDDLLERRGRHDATVDLSLRLVDHHGHEQARVAGGGVADERSDELRLGIAAELRVGLLGRTGLAGEPVARNLRLL